MKYLLQLILAMTFLLEACSSTPLKPAASKIVVSEIPPIGANCKLLGQITGHEGNFISGEWTSNEELEKGALNDLKNKAADMGANYLEILTTRQGGTGAFGAVVGFNDETTITNSANAYKCPESALSSLQK